MEYITTSALATVLDIKSSELYEKLKLLGWTERQNEKWVLTELGKQKGGQLKTHPQFGDFILWPENISSENTELKGKTKFLNATAIGKHFNISSQRLNLILSEFGWIERNIAGWIVTILGKSVGGRQVEHETSGGNYVKWPENILQNISLVNVFDTTITEKDPEKLIISAPQAHLQMATSTLNNFRAKFEAKHRTKDGHYVRSRAEVIIDDTLYYYGLVHAYEKKVPIEEELYTDFYLPDGKVYIEFWGMENDPKYLERKKIKLAIYKKYDLKLIELNDHDIANLDDHLPKKLLKYGIKVY